MESRIPGRLVPLLLLPSVILVLVVGPWSVTGDEALTMRLACSPWSTVVSSISADNHVPGFYAWEWLWGRAFGSSVLSFRISALVIVLAMILIASRTLPSWSALILALSPFTAHLAIEVRMYGMLALCGLLLLVTLRRWIESPGIPRGLCAALAVAAATWVHHFGWLGLPILLTVMLRRGERRDAFISAMLVLLLYLPWLPRAVAQFGSFGGVALDGAGRYLPGVTPAARLVGIPFSLGGTLLRFASGTAAFTFDLFSVREAGPWTFAGLAVGIVVLVMVVLGWKRAGPARVMLLWVLLPLALLRPSARHFALAFPAFAYAAGLGMRRSSTAFRPTRWLLPAALLALWLPLAFRGTVPQRTSYDRDFREAAALTTAVSDSLGLPVVIDLDLYSTLGMLRHFEELERAVSWHPHRILVESGTIFYSRIPDALSYLTVDSDSMIDDWERRYGDLLLVANDAGLASGPVTGDSNGFIGMGSGMISDADLMDLLEDRASVERIPLSGSSGPFSAVIVRFGEQL